MQDRVRKCVWFSIDPTSTNSLAISSLLVNLKGRPRPPTFSGSKFDSDLHSWYCLVTINFLLRKSLSDWCSVLQCVVVCCSVLSVLHLLSWYCLVTANSLLRKSLSDWCSVLQCVAVCCDVLHLHSLYCLLTHFWESHHVVAMGCSLRAPAPRGAGAPEYGVASVSRID